MSPKLSPRAHPTRIGSDTPPAERDARIGLLVADDHAAVRAGVCRLVGDQPDMRVVAEATSALSALTAGRRRPQVAVIDYHLGDDNGLWVTSRLARLDPRPRVLIYSAFTDDALALAAVIAGADGLLSKSAIGAELCLAIRRLAAGQRYFPTISPSVTRALGGRLSERQQPLFQMLVHGVSPELVRSRLGLTASELEAERAVILALLAPAATRAQAPERTRRPLDYERARRSWRPHPAPGARA